ncbi:5-azacytidine resistance protein [Pseudohyphozyma bogoriensis]|nr:5-azacytidine resistance protein [Pseudohyphozyma bogoriensis]
MMLLRPSTFHHLPRELVHSLTLSHRRSFTSSSLLSKYSYLTSYAFHGKPPYTPPPNEPAPKKLLQGFSPNSPVRKWRDEVIKEMPWGAGHDFLAVVPGKSEGELTVGIADGVGGWEDSGVDPSHFAQGLMFHVKEAVEAGEKDPRQVMEKGYAGVLKEEDILAGSSTACVATFHPDGLFRAANLGDSTFFIVRRPQKVVHAQPSQTHFFNAPRQLAKMPKGASKKGALIDSPSRAALFETTLEEGDIVVFATDGFSDNVWPEELAQLIALIQKNQAEEELSDEITLKRVAIACVNYARIVMGKMDKQTPFEVEARQYGKNWPGGKVDDVTIIAVQVKGKK